MASFTTVEIKDRISVRMELKDTKTTSVLSFQIFNEIIFLIIEEKLMKYSYFKAHSCMSEILTL